MVFARLGLARELRAWRRAGRAARLWWRDDDARGATPALLQLLDVAERHAAPLAVAAIPGPAVREIAAAVAVRPGVVIIQHGVDHVNRREGPAAGEFPRYLDGAEITARLAEGWAPLADAPCARKVFAPPWNDVHPELAEALADAGYAAWSAWGEIAFGGQPPRVDAHLDLLRWRGGARFRGAGRFTSALTAALRARRTRALWDEPIGLLTHHLDHDAAAWNYLDQFLAWARQEPAIVWTAPDSVFEGAGG